MNAAPGGMWLDAWLAESGRCLEEALGTADGGEGTDDGGSGTADGVEVVGGGRGGLLGPVALSQSIWALQCLGCVPDEAWLDRYCQVSLPLLLPLQPPQLSHATLASMAHSLAALGFRPPKAWVQVGGLFGALPGGLRVQAT